MNFHTRCLVGALFKLVCHKGDPSQPTKETGWFRNIVLNTGLDRLSVGQADNLCLIGSGNSTPTIIQTSLDSFLASTSRAVSASGGRNFTDPQKPFIFGRRTFRFDPGVGTGNIQEVALGWSDSDCFNRSLIKDNNGTPTTIQKLADEFLDVLVEVQLYPQPFISGQFNLRNKQGEIVSTHEYNGRVCLAFDPDSNWQLGQIWATNSWNYFYYGDENYIDDFTTLQQVNTNMTNIGCTYPTPRSMKAKAYINLDAGNTFQHKSFMCDISSLVGYQYGPVLRYKWEIDPPITKTNQQELTYTFNLSWNRYTG